MSYGIANDITEGKIRLAQLRFIDRVPTIPTNIGGFETDTINGAKLTVIGASLTANSIKYGDILKDISDIGDLKKPEVFSMDTSVRMAKFLVANNIKSDVMSKMDKVRNYKEVISPFSIGAKVKLFDVESAYGKDAGSIQYISFKIKPEDKTYSGYVFIDHGLADGKLLKLSFQDYMTKFKLSDMETLNARLDGNVKCIRMTSFGFIEPVEFVSGKTRVVIDSDNIYSVNSNSELSFLCAVDAYMTNSSVIEGVVKDKKILRALKGNAGYIKKHAKCMAAVAMCNNNVVEL